MLIALPAAAALLSWLLLDDTCGASKVDDTVGWGSWVGCTCPSSVGMGEDGGFGVEGGRGPGVGALAGNLAASVM